MNIDPINYSLRFWSDNIAPCVRDPGGLETLDQLDPSMPKVMSGKTVLVSGHASLRALVKLLEAILA